MISQRLRFSCFVVFLMLAVLATRLFYIQILRGSTYLQLAQKQFLRKIKEESFRGEILDRHENILATSVESQSVYIHPKELEGSSQQLNSFLSPLSFDSNSLNKKLSSSKDGFVWLGRKLKFHQVDQLAQKKIKGLGFVSEQKRYYPNGSLACHLIGAVGLDNYGLSGIEQTFDSFLAGSSFITDHLRDGKGRTVLDPSPKRPKSFCLPEKHFSHSLSLTIDRSLQFVAEKEIRRGVEETRSKSGMVVIQNPYTGEILAMASYPGFDPNELAEGNFQEGFKNSRLKNLVLSQLIEPGSTFKVVAFSAALEEKKWSLKDNIFCENGKWRVEDITINDHEPCGQLSFSEVLEKSSNIGTAKIALRLGKETLHHYARAFGFGTKTGIILSGESEGLLRNPKKWSKVSLPVISFGQEVGVTAIQMVTAFSVIANGGFLMEPLIVKQLNDSKNGKMVQKIFSPQKVRRVISPETANFMKKILVQVVERGTGLQAKVVGFSVAGKTGTAQKIDLKTKKYFADKYVASFCGFVPVKNPQLVCLVILDEPEGDYWGGTVAAPIFSRIISRSLQILGIPSDDPQKPVQLVRSK